MIVLGAIIEVLGKFFRYFFKYFWVPLVLGILTTLIYIFLRYGAYDTVTGWVNDAANAMFDTVQFEWLPLLSIQERQLLWKRYSGMGWKRLAGEAKVCERTVRNYINKALEKLYRKLR